MNVSDRILDKKSTDIFSIFRRYHGLFSMPDFLFPAKCSPASSFELSSYSPLVKPGDQLSDRVTVRGTKYRAGHVVVIKVHSSDVLEVGTILKVVLRKTIVLFLVSLSEAARTKLGFFETLPSNIVDLVQYEQLADFKPLIKRGDNACFPFVLHHHVPSPI